ncbi:MAG: diguanylate cyclase domain-containing protein [Acidimicrobiales bacterium]
MTLKESVTVPALADLISNEARSVGIRDLSLPDLGAVERRRSQLWGTSFVALLCMSACVAILASGHAELPLVHLLQFRIGTVVLVVALAAYVLEKERHLKRLTRLLIEERVLAAALSNRLREMASLYQAGRAMNSVLALAEVLELILTSSMELLEAGSGSVMLVDGVDELEVVAEVGNPSARGARCRIGTGIAGRAAGLREAQLVEGQDSGHGSRTVPVDSAICLPLIHRDELLGVLNVNGTAARQFTPYDLRAISLFAEHAAIAVANSRLYEEQRSRVERLAHDALHDPLTGLANRSLIIDRIELALARCRRSNHLMAVLFIDLDDFKRVNDQCGHSAGDHVLLEVADRLRSVVRPTETVGRLAGDEFIVIAEQIEGPDRADSLARRITKVLQLPITVGERVIAISGSVGVVVGGEDDQAQHLLERADQAMYRSKARSRSRV